MASILVCDATGAGQTATVAERIVVRSRVQDHEATALVRDRLAGTPDDHPGGGPAADHSRGRLARRVAGGPR